VADVGADREAKNEQLHHRHREHEPQRRRIAPHLDEFLAHHRAQAFRVHASLS
jgi:hypothetical protein